MTSMYAERAGLYDRIYHWKDYAGEATRLRELLRAEGLADGARVLDAACGTGSHLAHLRAWYDVAGFDRSEDMLAVARGKLPGVHLWRAELTGVAVERPYDATLCLFSSIGYLTDEAGLRAAARALAGTVRPGGVLLVEPWLEAASYTVGKPSLATYTSPELCLARASVAAREGELSISDMHWLVAPAGGEVERFSERHVLWLCPRPVLVAAFQAAGLEARLEEAGLMKDRGLLIARKPA